MISGKTKIVGVFGDPVAHTLSPPMHMAALRHLDLDWVYVPFHVKPGALEDAVKGIRALNLRGVNVTVPHKVKVMQYLDDIDEEARVIGAVNTIVNDDGRLIGINTDGRGFIRSLQAQGHDVNGKNVFLIGAGGAALAIAAACALGGAASIAIANRTVEKAEHIARTVTPLFAGHGRAVAIPLTEVTVGAPVDSLLADVAGQAHIAVQTTSVGMAPNHAVPPVLSPRLFTGKPVCVDIVYTPRQTTFLQEARALGCETVTGEGMLAYQGAIALERWTGMDVPEALMLQTLQQLLDHRSKT